jgi:hypothetical protein
MRIITSKIKQKTGQSRRSKYALNNESMNEKLFLRFLEYYSTFFGSPIIWLKQQAPLFALNW